MLELGVQSEAAHRELGRLINNFPALRVIAVGPMMKFLAEEVKTECHWFANATDAGKKIGMILDGAKMVLMKGSRGIALERILRELPEDLQK